MSKKNKNICNEFEGFLVDKCVPHKVKDILGEDKIICGRKINLKPDMTRNFFHIELMKKLKKISDDNEFPNIIFYGRAGVGKKVLLNLFLEMIFGEYVHDTVDACYNVKSSGNVENKVIVKQSDYHIIIQPNNNNFDRYLIRHIVVEYAKKEPLNVFKDIKDKKFKVVQINGLEELSEGAQTSLRRTIEKYVRTCRFIMWTKSLSNVISPLRSRCTLIHVPTIEKNLLLKWAFDLTKKSNIKIKYGKLNKIIDDSNGNLKTILWKLDLYKYTGKMINTYDKKIDYLSDLIIKKEKIKIIRAVIYSFLTTNIEHNQIIIDLLNSILKKIKLDDDKIEKIIQSASEYEYRLSSARREIIHIEAFVTDLINILKK